MIGPAVAVLPFDNFSPDPEDAYFAGGMQEEITSALSRISALRVISRTSVMQYDEIRPPTPEIADELDVDFIVEGSARLAGDAVRLSAQLIDAQADTRLWGDEYNRALTAQEVWDLQADVARQVAFAIGVTITPGEVDRVANVLTDSTEAFLLFMDANERFLDERLAGTLIDETPSMRLYQSAIDADPNFALARARLALSLTYTNPDDERLEQAKTEADIALSLFSDIPDARLALGRYAEARGRGEEAARHYRAAQDDASASVRALELLARLLQGRGEFEEAALTYERAAQVAPRDPRILRALAATYIHAHRYDEALTVITVGEELSGLTHPWRAWVHLLRDQPDEAQSVATEVFGRGAFGAMEALPQAVMRRGMLTQDQRRQWLAAWRQSPPESGCDISRERCTMTAAYEYQEGSPELARIYWDSLRASAESRPLATWIELARAALMYEGLGNKEAAIRTAEAVVSLRGARREGAVEDLFYYGHHGQMLLARVLAHFDEADRAIDILEEALPAPSWISASVLQIDPLWDPLRDHPRFQALLERYSQPN